MNDFCHLHMHDTYSILDGIGTTKEYVNLANELDMKYLAQTNHGNINGSIEHQIECVKGGIHPIFGCEMYIVNDINVKEKGNSHVVLLVKNSVGWDNLLKMLNIANSIGFYSKPRIDLEVLLNHLDGLILLSACTSSFLQICSEDYLKKLLEVKQEDFYLEVMPLNWDKQKTWNEEILRISDKYSIPIVATNDCHYPSKLDAFVQEVSLAIQTKVKFSDAKRWKFEMNDLYLKSRRRMVEDFKKQGVLSLSQINTALNNTVEIAEKCNFEIKPKTILLPDIKTVKDNKLSSDDFFARLCEKKLHSLLESNKKINKEVYTERFNKELKLIIGMKFHQYFLIVWELTEWSKSRGILIGPGRGSASGSLISYLLGITAVDPIYHNLLFERFISEGRSELPDIDLDFDIKKRDLVKNHLAEEYGRDNVANISTFLRIKGRMAIRDVCRVFDIMDKNIEELLSKIEENTESIFETDETGRRVYEKYKKEMDVVKKLEGQIRSMGSHAAGVVISEKKLEDCSVIIDRNGSKVVNWDKTHLEHIGLIKLDILGLANMSIISDTISLIKENSGTTIDPYNLDMEDKSIYEEFAKGNNVGCFQFNTNSLIQLCKRTKPSSFKELTNLVAVFRPALISRGMVDQYVDNSQRGWEHKNPILNSILKDTFGIILYQEQIMDIVNKLSGMSLSEADEVRKTFNKKGASDKVVAMEDVFISGAMKNGLRQREAKSIWEELSVSSGYGFSLAHAVGYTTISYVNMYLKKYFPTEFFCASLSNSQDDKKQDLIYDAIKNSVSVCRPDILVSHSDEWVISNGKIHAPFTTIFGVGTKIAEKIVKKEKLTPSIEAKVNTGKLIVTIPDFDDINIYAKNGEESISNLFSCNFDLQEKLIVSTRARNFKDIADCKKCSLSIKGMPVAIKKGTLNVMVCGESPNSRDFQTGKFDLNSAKSYNVILDCMKKNQINPQKLYFSNIIKCAPLGEKISPTCVKQCSSYIKEEISLINPVLILAVGKFAGEFFSGEEGFSIMKNNGVVAWSDAFKCWIFYVLHPAILSKKPELERSVGDALNKFCNLFKKLSKID